MRTLSLELLRESGNLDDSVMIGLVTGEADMDRIALWLDTVLDETFLMVRNVDLPGGHTSIDFLVAGPPGIWALYVEADPGQFKSEGGDFYSWESRNGNYVKISPSPLLILKSNLTQLQGWLKDNRLPAEAVRTAILFTDPAAVIESGGGDVELIGPQLVEAYPVEIVHAAPLLAEADIERFLVAVAKGRLPKQPPLLANAGDDRQDSPLSRLPSFSRPQWAVLSALAFLDVFVLGAFCVWAIFFNA